jgi:uncharacterized protein YbjT (DUF2867 family)
MSATLDDPGLVRLREIPEPSPQSLEQSDLGIGSSPTGVFHGCHLGVTLRRCPHRQRRKLSCTDWKGHTVKIVVVGGTGLIGSKVVAKLRDDGHEAVAASPETGVNTVTGEGLPEALEGAAVVVDVSNSPSFEDAAVLEFFQTSTHNVLDAEDANGVGHHVALSVVGNDRLPASGYLRAKAAQEKLIMASSIPYSIVRATQFFEFAQAIAQAATSGDTVLLPPVLFQPLAAEDVARFVTSTSVGAPVNGIVEVAGPEVFRFDEFIRRGLAARNDPRRVIADPHALYYGTELGERSLLPREKAQLGATRFEDWLGAAVATA